MKNILLLLCLLLNSFDVIASELRGELQAGNPVKWQAISVGYDEWSPAYWDISMRLPPAEKVILGGAPMSNSISMVVTSATNQVPLQLQLLGMQYQLVTGATISNLTSGTSALIKGDQMTVKGIGLADQLVSFETTITPFTHYRPIIKLIDNLASSFEGKPSGLYRGRALANIPYDYYREGIRIRHTLSFPIEILINYSANHIISVSVTGNNEMQTRYYGYPESLVAGETSYQVSISGLFNNGVFIGLRASTHADGRFYLKENSGNIEQAIPFSVYCHGCLTNNQFINQFGEAQIDLFKKAKAFNGFNLRVAFEDVKLADLKDTTYQGNFTLVFEAIF